MQSKGNIDIFDETKNKGYTLDIKKNEGSAKPKGNVDVIDDTNENANEFSENGKEACGSPKRLSITKNTVKENVEYGESADQGNKATMPTSNICTQHKDANDNAKLNTDEGSNVNDDDTSQSCNENKLNTDEGSNGNDDDTSQSCNENKSNTDEDSNGNYNDTSQYCNENKLNTDEGSNGNDDDTSLSCNENKVNNDEGSNGNDDVTSLSCNENKVNNDEGSNGNDDDTSLFCNENRLNTDIGSNGNDDDTSQSCNENKLNTDESSNGNDDETSLSCNENKSFSVNGTFTPTEISEKVSYSREVTSASTHDLSYSRITKNNGLTDAHDNHSLSFQTKEISAASNAAGTAGDLLTPCSENSSIKSFEKASDNCADLCDFCKRSSQFMCMFCTFFYCKSCLDRVHPAVGPYKSHKVVTIQEGVRLEHYKRCREHGLVAQLFCSYCEVHRCTECFKTRCRLHFKGRVSAGDIEKERELLVEELERATAKLGFLEKYKESVQDQIDNIQLTGMLRREHIRQEFVSFHDLLIQKESKMLQQLDQDVTERVDHVVNTLQASVSTLEQEDARLTTTVTELIQSGNDAYFIEEYVTAKDLCRQVDDKVRDFDREWAKNCTFTHRPLLDNHFTMIVEKKQLSERLDGTMEHPQLKFTQSTLYVDSDDTPLQISDYLEPPLIPTSTELSYILELLFNGKVVYSKQTNTLQDLKLSPYTLQRGNRYLLKVTPTYTCLPSSVKCQKHNTWKGKKCHMLIVVSQRPKPLPRVVKRETTISRRTVCVNGFRRRISRKIPSFKEA